METPHDPNAPNPSTFGKILPFRTLATRRMRYWTDGLLIGSQAFIMELITNARGARACTQSQLTRELAAPDNPHPLFCFRRLRDIPI